MPVKLLKTRIIHAGPTTGKTTLAQALEAVGVLVLDSDDLLKAVAPEAIVNKWHRSSDPAVKAQFRQAKVEAELLALEKLRAEPRSLLLTNLWGPDSVQLAQSEFGIRGRLPISFFCIDPELMATRSVNRALAAGKSPQRGIPLSLAKKWIHEWRSHAQDYFYRTVELTSEFLNDAIDLDGNPVLGKHTWEEVLSHIQADVTHSGLATAMMAGGADVTGETK